MKLLKTIALTAWILLISLFLVSASYWIYSSVVHVKVTEYVLTLSAPETVVVSTPITFSGTLMLDGSPIVGAVIHINQTDSGGVSIVELGTTTTISNGSFTYQWTPTVTGDLYFKAGYTP